MTKQMERMPSILTLKYERKHSIGKQYMEDGIEENVTQTFLKGKIKEKSRKRKAKDNGNGKGRGSEKVESQ
jgi:hypothetical protein